MWSLNRDQSCGPNYANVQIVSPSCSGITQDSGAFRAVLSNFHPPAVHPSQDPAAGSSASAYALTDDPARSPYPIWQASRAYPKGTKIVWHHNVYEAKWYTQGDVPDAPVAQPTDTPWTLIGPVLPGETPAPTPTLPAGTYPDWTATQIYLAGDRVLHDGVGYEAKWWTQGDVPGQPVQSPSDTPWEPLTSTS
jgi:chitinase